MKWILHEKTLLLLLFLEKANSLGSEINCDVSTFRRQLSVLLLLGLECLPESITSGPSSSVKVEK